MSPERSGGIFTRSRCTRGSSPRDSRRRCHATNAQIRKAPKAMTKSVSEKPNGSSGDSFGWTQPQVVDCRTPRTTSPRPGRGQDGADAVEMRWHAVERRVADVPAQDEDDQHQHDLADEHDAPAELGGGPAAEDGPDRDSGTRDAADDRVGGLARGSLEVARRSAPPSPGARARRRGLPGSTSRRPASAPSATPPSARCRRRRSPGR